MNTPTAIIEGKQLSIGYTTGRHRHIVHEELCFRLLPGELTCLLGANGSGKSTLLRTLAAAQSPLSGQLELLGKPISAYSERERSRHIGVVLTDKTQTGGLSVYDLVALGRQPHTGFFGRLRAADHQKVEQALAAVGIADKAWCYTADLSDGERQKAMIAKALVQECPLILLDEPTAFLDVVSRIEIMHLLHRLAAEEHRAILLSTHDIDQALVLADRLWLLRKEKGMQCGVTEDLILSGALDQLFPHPDILFDRMHGVYSPAVKGRRSIRLRAADETLLHWTQNALNRHQFLCLPYDKEGSDHLPLLEVWSPCRLELHTVNGFRSFTSFESLLEHAGHFATDV